MTGIKELKRKYLDECEDFLENLAKYYNCSFKIIDLNKFNEYEKYLKPHKNVLARYEHKDFYPKNCNFVGIFAKDTVVVLCGAMGYSKAKAIINLRDAYKRKLTYDTIEFNYSWHKTDLMFNDNWLDVSSSNEVKMHMAIEGK